MTEYIFKHTRLVNGKRVRARLYHGRYSLGRGQQPVTVPLDTPDELVARKRLRDIIVERQREAEGIVAPRAVREAAVESLPDLIAEFHADLLGRGVTRRYANMTVHRIRRIVKEAAWSRLVDVTPEAFVRWRSLFAGSAKTKKEYQAALLSFLNWLVRLDRLIVNPLKRVDRVDIRGKMVRPIRALTEQELQALFRVAGRRLPAYLVLAYTGLRKKEVKALVWSDLHLDEAQPYLLAREGTTKDREKRSIPLHAQLVPVLRSIRPKRAGDADRVFAGRFPKRGSLLRDFKRAGIPRVDAMGRVAHFHSFRKAFQTLGVRYGVNQRSAQALLGHSDPRLTANVYTDVPGLELHHEVAKLPWLADTQIRTLEHTKSECVSLFRQKVSELADVANKLVDQQFTSYSSAAKMVEVAGVEPACP